MDNPRLTTLVNVERACSDFVGAYEQWKGALREIPDGSVPCAADSEARNIMGMKHNVSSAGKVRMIRSAKHPTKRTITDILVEPKSSGEQLLAGVIFLSVPILFLVAAGLLAGSGG